MTIRTQLDTSFRIDVIPNLVHDMTRPGDDRTPAEMPPSQGFPPAVGVPFHVRARPVKIEVLPEFPRILGRGRNAAADPDQP